MALNIINDNNIFWFVVVEVNVCLRSGVCVVNIIGLYNCTKRSILKIKQFT